MKKLLAGTAFMATILGGCTTAVPIMAPSGTYGYSLNCSSSGDIGACYRKAGEMCPARYDVIDQHNKSPGFFTNADRSLIVRCKLLEERVESKTLVKAEK